MKQLLSSPIHKIITGIGIILLLYVSLYELWFSNIPSSSVEVYKWGLLTSKLSYSLLSASIFYLVTQYIGVYRPRKRKKIKVILPYVHRQVTTLDYICDTLKYHLNINGNDFKKSSEFREVLKSVKVDEPIGEFKNWHQYLYHMKFQILDVIRGIYFYNEYLSEDFLHEIVLIEERLMSPITFCGYKQLAITNLSYAELDLQEILIHNLHLQNLRETESKKHDEEFEASGKEYRKKYYPEQSQG